MQGRRYITWTKLAGDMVVTELPMKYGKDAYDAGASFLHEIQIRRQECEACAKIADDMAKARDLAGDHES